MLTIGEIATCALPPALVSFRSLKARSIAAWQTLKASSDYDYRPVEEVLNSIATLDDLLNHHAVFYFFLTRDAFLNADRMKKWNSDSLDDYILLIGCSVPLNVNRDDCIFVSHYWISSDDPDPNAEYLRKIQGDTRQTEWSYLWIDWSCVPQRPRSNPGANYSTRILRTVPFLVRNCSYMFFYPPFEPRLWILYETAEYMLTSINSMEVYRDNRTFVNHVQEMMKIGVRPVLEKYGYRCSVSRDRKLLTAWLEVLVTMRKLKLEPDSVVDMITKRHILDSIIWHAQTKAGVLLQALTSGKTVELNVRKGYVEFEGQRHAFTPFPHIVATADLV